MEEALLSPFFLHEKNWAVRKDTGDMKWPALIPKACFLNLLKSTPPTGISFPYITHLCGYIRTVRKSPIIHNYFKRSSFFICSHYTQSLTESKLLPAFSQSGLTFNGPKCFSELLYCYLAIHKYSDLSSCRLTHK